MVTLPPMHITVCRCARAVCAWRSAPPSGSAAIATLISSSAPGANSSSCGRDLAGSSASSAARLMAMRRWKLASARYSIWRSGCAPGISISAAPRSMRYMPRRSSASARGKPARLTSSAARLVSPPP